VRNERDGGTGEGTTLDDIRLGADCKSVELRSERDESRNGRVYTVTLRIQDALGNVARGVFKVTVPLGRNGVPAIEDAAVLTVTSLCD
jgi:hypothetical protein